MSLVIWMRHGCVSKQLRGVKWVEGGMHRMKQGLYLSRKALVQQDEAWVG